MSGRYGLVVFDWDGTLVDSLGRIVAALRATIDEMKLPPKTDHELRAGVGLGFDEVVRRLFPELGVDDRARVRLVFRERFLADGTDSRLFPGAREALEALAREGMTLAVATGKGRAGLDRELIETGLADLMVATRCVDECASKPAPEMLEQLMEATGHARDATLMVGDSEYDLLMAKNAGTAAVGVAGGAHGHSTLARHEPLAIIDSVAELPPLIRS